MAVAAHAVWQCSKSLQECSESLQAAPDAPLLKEFLLRPCWLPLPLPPCSMCLRIGALPGLRLVFRDYIRTAGAAVVMDKHKVGGQAGLASRVRPPNMKLCRRVQVQPSFESAAK